MSREIGPFKYPRRERYGELARVAFTVTDSAALPRNPRNAQVSLNSIKTEYPPKGHRSVRVHHAAFPIHETQALAALACSSTEASSRKTVAWGSRSGSASSMTSA